MHKQSTYEAFIKRMEAELVLASKEDKRLRGVAESVMDGVPSQTAEIEGKKVSMRNIPPHLKRAHTDAWSAVTKHELHVVNAIKSDIRNAMRVIDIIERANYDIEEIKFNNKIETQ